MDLIKRLEERVLALNEITYEEALVLSKVEDLERLLEAAGRVRKHFCGDSIDMCSIMNAKSGRCSENCKYCAQSVHYNTGVKEYGLVSEEEALKMALDNEKEGVHRFSLVTSGRGLYKDELNKITKIYKFINENSEIDLCASHGILNYDDFLQLKSSGVRMYHHNLETSRRYFPQICDTHSYDDRIETINKAKKAGMEICSGGIIGMGETMEDRIDMAFDLKRLEVDSVPMNILNPIKGTPLENTPAVTTEEVLKTIAIFRFILPKVKIRFAGGRALLGEDQDKALKGGVNAALVGNLLTTIGNNIEKDKKLFADLGFNLK